MVLRLLCLLGTCVYFSFGAKLDLDLPYVQEKLAPIFTNLLTLSITRSSEGDLDKPISHEEPRSSTTEDVHSSSHRYTHESPDMYSTDIPTIESTKGFHGMKFLKVEDMPETSFDCSDKPYIPGIYADVETGCKVFYLCWPRMTETLMCGPGKIFNVTSEFCDVSEHNTCLESNDAKNKLHVESYKNVSHLIHDEEPFSYGELYDALAKKIEVLYHMLLEHVPEFHDFLTADEELYKHLTNSVNDAHSFLPISRSVTINDPPLSVRAKKSAGSRVGKLKDSRPTQKPIDDAYVIEVLTNLVESIREYILRNDINKINIDGPLVLLLFSAAKLIFFLYAITL